MRSTLDSGSLTVPGPTSSTTVPALFEITSPTSRPPPLSQTSSALAPAAEAARTSVSTTRILTSRGLSALKEARSQPSLRRRRAVVLPPAREGFRPARRSTGPPDRMPPGMDIRAQWRGLPGLTTVGVLAIARPRRCRGGAGGLLLIGVPSAALVLGIAALLALAARGLGVTGFAPAVGLGGAARPPRRPAPARERRSLRAAAPRAGRGGPRRRGVPCPAVPAVRLRARGRRHRLCRRGLAGAGAGGTARGRAALPDGRGEPPAGPRPAPRAGLRRAPLRGVHGRGARAALSRARPGRSDLLGARDRSLAAGPAGVRARRVRRRVLLHGARSRCCSCARCTRCSARPGRGRGLPRRSRRSWRSRLRSCSTSVSSSPRSRPRSCWRAPCGGLVAPAPWRARDVVVWALPLCALPWFNVRYAPVTAIVLAGAIAARPAVRVAGALASRPPCRRRWGSRCIITLSTGSSIRGSCGARAPSSALATLAEGLPGLALDQEFGLLPYAPVFAFCVPGLIRLVRERTRLAVVSVALALAVLGTAGSWHMWRGGFNPPARFLVPLLPVFALALARAFRGGLGAAGALVVGWGLWVGACGRVGSVARPPRPGRDRPVLPRLVGRRGVDPPAARFRARGIRGATAAALTAVWTAGARGRGARPAARHAVGRRDWRSRRPRWSSPRRSPRRSRAPARAGGTPCASSIGRRCRVPGGAPGRRRRGLGPAALDWGPLYEPHRHPAGAVVGARLPLPPGRYRVRSRRRRLLGGQAPVLELWPEGAVRGIVTPLEPSEGGLSGAADVASRRRHPPAAGRQPDRAEGDTAGASTFRIRRRSNRPMNARVSA